MDFSLEKNPPPSVFTKVNDYPSDLSENCFWFRGFFVFASSHSLVTIGFLFSFKTITGWTFGLWSGYESFAFPEGIM